MADVDYWTWAINLHLSKRSLVFTFQSGLHGEEQFNLDVANEHLAEVLTVMKPLTDLEAEDIWLPRAESSGSGSCEFAMASLPACVVVPAGFRARVQEFVDNAEVYAMKALTSKRSEWDHVWAFSNLKRTLNRLKVLRRADLPNGHALVGMTVDGISFELERDAVDVWDYKTIREDIVALELGQVVELSGLDVVRTWALPHLPLLFLSPWVAPAALRIAEAAFPSLRLTLEGMRDFFRDPTMLANIEAMVDHRLLCLNEGSAGQALLLTNEDGATRVLFGHVDQVLVRHHVICRPPVAGFPTNSVLQVDKQTGHCLRVWALRHDPGLWLDDKKFLDDKHQEGLLDRLGLALIAKS